MNRKIKNIILVLIVLISSLGIYFTLNYAKKSIDTNSTNDKQIVHIDDKTNNNNTNNNSSTDNDSNEKSGPPSIDNSSGTGAIMKNDKDINTNSFSLQAKYIVVIIIFSLIISLDIIYLIMSKTSKEKAFKDTNKIIIYILSNIILTSIISFTTTVLANNLYLNNETSNVNYSSTSDLHIDMDNWSYDDVNNVYYQIGVVYTSKPVSKEYESLGIYVPGDYLDCTKKGDVYSCALNIKNEVSGYTSSTAPIVMPINTAGYSEQKAPTSYNYNSISSYIKAGYIYVYAGARGRNNTSDYTGGAPWGVTDFKAAIRYLKYNSTNLPGDEESIFVFGHSGGGAISTILGSSADSKLYDDYLKEIGALTKDDEGNKLSDSIKGVMAWCPITNLDTADAAYEWNMGQYSTSGTRSESTWKSALSKDLAEAYGEYINKLKLKDESGDALSLSKTNNTIYTSGTYYNYVKSLIERSLNNYLNTNFTSVNDMKNYVSKYSFISFNENTKTATITSIEDFVKTFKNATKSVGAFDSLNKSAAENYVFGNQKYDNLHFDQIMSDILNNNDYSSYSDYDSKYKEEYKKDITYKDSLNNSSLVRQNMYNPMYYLSSYYGGYKTSTVAENWRIRTGITQGDTSLTTEINLALALQNYGISNVDFETIWEQGHTQAELSGNATSNFISWVNEIMK